MQGTSGGKQAVGLFPLETACARARAASLASRRPDHSKTIPPSLSVIVTRRACKTPCRPCRLLAVKNYFSDSEQQCIRFGRTVGCQRRKKNEYTGNTGHGGSITNCYCTRIAPISPSTYDEMSCLTVQIGRGTDTPATTIRG